jgi:hypothetical protein
MKPYTATKSRNAGRESWSVIFRHPARLDITTAKPGRRVRRGLGTADEAEANRLIDQLNEILRTEELWEPAARATAAGRFDSRVIDIFYDRLEATRTDFSALRQGPYPSLSRLRWLSYGPVPRHDRGRQDDRGAPTAGD